MNIGLLSLCLGRTGVSETFRLNALWWLNIDQLTHEFSVSISCNSKTKFHYELQTYDTNRVNDINSPKNCSKNNLHSGSYKPGFPNSSLEDGLIELSYISIFEDFQHTKVFQWISQILLKSKVNHEWFLFSLIYKTVKTIFAKPRKIR